jgi:predicted metal-dependent HD superfamily phosphohydrolase
MSALITIAACAHDVVYDARPGEDERHSSPRSVARELNRYRQGPRIEDDACRGDATPDHSRR